MYRQIARCCIRTASHPIQFVVCSMWWSEWMDGINASHVLPSQPDRPPKFTPVTSSPNRDGWETWGRKGNQLLSYLDRTLSTPVSTLLIPSISDISAGVLDDHITSFIRRTTSHRQRIIIDIHLHYYYYHHHRHSPHRRWKTSSPYPSTTSPPAIPPEPGKVSDRLKAYSPKSASLMATTTTIND